RSDDGQHIVIRPLAYVAEAEIAEYAALRAFPIIPCSLCGSQENLQRKQVRQMMDAWERQHPGRLETIFRALGNVVPAQLADRDLFDFAALGARGNTPAPDAHAWLAGVPHELAAATA
ncbi:C32 tRNA thiolase, partial [mine drainage metagenome]